MRYRRQSRCMHAPSTFDEVAQRSPDPIGLQPRGCRGRCGDNRVPYHRIQARFCAQVVSGCYVHRLPLSDFRCAPPKALSVAARRVS